MLLKDIEFTIFDLEWVTRKSGKSYIIEIGAVKLKNGKIIAKFNKLLKYTKPIAPVIFKLTGITNQMLLYGEERENTILEFLLFIENSVLVAHDINNDLKVLKEESDRLGLEVKNEKICTLRLSQKIFLFEKYNLQDLAKDLGIKTYNTHRAYKDAYILYGIFEKLLMALPEEIDTAEKILNLNKGKKRLIKHITEIINIDNNLKYKGFFDGASAGNPGKMGTGFVIFNEKDDVIIEGSEYIGVGTNNEAEYQALISLLEFAVENKIETLEVFGDSKLVIEQVLGRWKVKAENLKPFAKIAQNLFSKVPNISINWIGRDFNTFADKLSKKGVDAG